MLCMTYYLITLLLVLAACAVKTGFGLGTWRSPTGEVANAVQVIACTTKPALVYAFQYSAPLRGLDQDIILPVVRTRILLRVRTSTSYDINNKSSKYSCAAAYCYVT